MFTIVKKLDFCYGHRLMDYEGPCCHAHGHNATLEVELQSPTLNEVGMVVDFGDVDDALADFIVNELDHRMLLRGDDPLVDALNSVGESAFLLLADAWFPGWNVYRNGEKVRLYRADYAFRAVHLPAGEHMLDFRYEPASFRWGVAISGASLVISLLILLVGLTRRGTSS